MNEQRWEEGYDSGRAAWEEYTGGRGDTINDRGPLSWMNDPAVIDDVAGGIPVEDIDALTGMVTGFIAEVIQTYIDAGSERDVIREDDELYLVLSRVFRDWSPDWEKPKGYVFAEPP